MRTARLSLPVLAAILALTAPAQAQAQAQLPNQPAQVYLAVDHFEIRFEIAIRLRNFAPHLPLDQFLSPSDTLAASKKSTLLQALTPLLRNAGSISANGEPVNLKLDRLQFVSVDEKNGVLPDERDPIPLEEALVAAIFSAPCSRLPETASVQWSLFPPPTEFDPARHTLHLHLNSPTSRRTVTLLPLEDGRAASHTFRIPPAESVPAVLEVPPPPANSVFRLPLLSVLCLVAFAAITIVGLRLSDRMPTALAPVSLLAAFAALFLWNHARIELPNPFAKPIPVSADTANEIVYSLLRNIYHAFDYRGESAIYDTLALSAHGDLLTEIYLEIRRSLELENQGGARVRIQNVDLRKCSPGQDKSHRPPAFAADCEWIAIGSITHWGHTHTRLNKYSATLDVAPVAGRYKITALNVVNEERL